MSPSTRVGCSRTGPGSGSCCSQILIAIAEVHSAMHLVKSVARTGTRRPDETADNTDEVRVHSGDAGWRAATTE